MDWKDVLKTVAPTLGTALLGPLGGLAVKVASEALDLPEATEEALKQAVTGGSPETMLKLKQADQAFEVRLKELGIEADKLELLDREGARSRDVEYVKQGRNNTRGDILAYTAIGALTADILLLFFVTVPTSSRDILLVALGALVAIVKDVYSFEFGSSKDSQRNAQAVADMLRQA